MNTTPARTRARVRAIVVAVLVLAFVIPWTYAHIAYAWPWKEQSTSDACTGKYYLTPYDKHFVGITGKVSMGRQSGSFSVSALTGYDDYDLIGLAIDLHRGDSITVEGVGTFTLKEAHSDIIWFTPNPGKATFCFDPDPTFTTNNYAQQGH